MADHVSTDSAKICATQQNGAAQLAAGFALTCEIGFDLMGVEHPLVKETALRLPLDLGIRFRNIDSQWFQCEAIEIRTVARPHL